MTNFAAMRLLPERRPPPVDSTLLARQRFDNNLARRPQRRRHELQLGPIQSACQIMPISETLSF